MSDHDWKQTPTLDDFAAMYDEDDNLWWRIDSGHHLNLYEAARERYEAAEVVIQAVRDALYEGCTVPPGVDYDSFTVGWIEARNVAYRVLDGGDDE